MLLTKGSSRLFKSFLIIFILSLTLFIQVSVSYASTICRTYLVDSTENSTSLDLKEEGQLKLPGHRQIFYQTFNLRDPEQPVLVFFPGIYSALAYDSDFFKYLESKNIPYVNFHFSSHPKSIATLNPEAELPDYQNLRTEDLAFEVEQLVLHLGLKKPLAVTTSYSSTLINHFPNGLFSKIIDTAPIGRLHEDHELQFYFTNIWNTFSSFNPATFWLNAHLQSQGSYHFWNTHVNLLKESYTELQNPILNDLSTKAYLAMIKAIEKYDIRKVDFKNGPERIFILAADESRRRLQLQHDAIRVAEQQMGYPPEVYTIEGADHIVAYSQPEVYANLLIQILEGL